MTEYEIKFENLYVRVEADSEAEALEMAKAFAPRTPRRMGSAPAPVAKVSVATEPVGFGSEAE